METRLRLHGLNDIAAQPGQILKSRVSHTHYIYGDVPITVGNETIGAIGVSGAAGKNDACAKVRVGKVGEQLT